MASLGGAANRRGVSTKSSGRDDDAGTPTGQRWVLRERPMLKSMSAAASVVSRVRAAAAASSSVVSRVFRTSRRESSSTGEQSHTSHAHKHRRSRYTSDCVRVCILYVGGGDQNTPSGVARDSAGLRSSL